MYSVISPRILTLPHKLIHHVREQVDREPSHREERVASKCNENGEQDMRALPLRPAEELVAGATLRSNFRSCLFYCRGLARRVGDAQRALALEGVLVSE